MKMRLFWLLLSAALMSVSCQSTDATADNNGFEGLVQLAQPTGVGEGTAQSPYTVGQVMKGVNKTTDVWVAGYVVGYVTRTINNATFGAAVATTDNIMLASSADEKDKSRVLVVELSSDRTKKGVSLAYNPQGLGKAVMLHVGVIAQYMSAPGLRGVDDYLWIAAPETLDLGSGWGEEDGSGNEESDDPDEPDTPDTPDTPNTPDTPDEPNVPDEPQEEDEDGIFSIYGITDIDPIAGVNAESGRSERYPCYPDYIFNSGLIDMYKDAAGWIIGYPRGWTEDRKGIVIGSTSDGALANRTYFVLDLKDEALKWMTDTYRDNKDGMRLRICGKLKLRNQLYHIINVECIDWQKP